MRVVGYVRTSASGSGGTTVAEKRARLHAYCEVYGLTRRVVDVCTLVETYFADGRWHLLSVADSIDTRTATGRMVLNIIVTVAQWEREANVDD